MSIGRLQRRRPSDGVGVMGLMGQAMSRICEKSRMNFAKSLFFLHDFSQLTYPIKSCKDS